MVNNTTAGNVMASSDEIYHDCNIGTILRMSSFRDTMFMEIRTDPSQDFRKVEVNAVKVQIAMEK
ncbi:hypothetical protein BGAL_0489g00030 [Botrytis galanthina]|uniref:Uncharacterized protein n=1 Tax=Botrytis galanthina TaxID=278940 RepID=A0A4S8QL16_9HELO|nr:hypothetical protein BGAL_0489g00030 [Botrytis galanthina]